MTMTFKLPSKEYNCYLVLMNSNKTDIRIYKISA